MIRELATPHQPAEVIGAIAALPGRRLEGEEVGASRAEVRLELAGGIIPGAWRPA